MRTTRQPPWWIGVTATGMGLLGAALIGPAQLAHGGLLPLAVAVTVGAVLGVPLARSVWMTPNTRREQSIVLYVYWLSLAAASASSASALMRLIPWVGAAMLSWSASAGGVALIGVVLVVGMLPVALFHQPWELLQPSSRDTLSWLSVATVAGLLSTWAPGHWSSASSAPGRGGLPECSGGVALFSLVGVGIVHAASVVVPSLGVSGSVLQLFLVATAAVVFVSLQSPRGRVLAIVCGGLAAQLFGLLGATLVWWSTTAPAMLAVVAVFRAVRTRELRWWLTSLGLGGLSVVCFPGIPQGIGGGMGAALPIVGAVWFVGLIDLWGER